MGAGISRMNIYTVAQATQGLAELIRQENAADKGVAIAHDSRNNSRLFAEISARVLAANGITVYLFDSLRPTPELSFAILELGCISGINITASHNPKEYNGYKVYWSDGAQLPPEHAAVVCEKIAGCDMFSVPMADLSDKHIHVIGSEIDEKYIDAVLGCVIDRDALKEFGNSLNLVYTPLHGTGYRLVPAFQISPSYRSRQFRTAISRPSLHPIPKTNLASKWRLTISNSIICPPTLLSPQTRTAIASALP